jgi:hypothetical protein
LLPHGGAAIIAAKKEHWMNQRILSAGFAAGIVMFVWTSLAHTVLPFGTVGIKEIPNEQEVLAAMQSKLGEASGLYLFPGLGLGPNPSRRQERAAMQEYATKLARNPSGLLIYHPPGAKALTPRQLGAEFLTEVVEALLVVYLLGQTRIASFSGRIGFVALAGVLASMTTNLPYWNWYGFPPTYTAAYMGIQMVGFLLVGLVAAALMKEGAPKSLPS